MRFEKKPSLLNLWAHAERVPCVWNAAAIRRLLLMGEHFRARIQILYNDGEFMHVKD